MVDKISEYIVKLLDQRQEPLETTEITEEVMKHVKGATRTKIFYRLNLLRGESKIKGKHVGSGKGAWVWWK